jgi:hypothetical protein
VPLLHIPIWLTGTLGAKHHKGASDNVDEDGILEDIILTSTSVSAATHRCEAKTCDVDAFFEEAQLFPIGDGSTKRYRMCKNFP